MAKPLMKKGVKDYWKKFWFLLWKDDSFKGWIFSVIFLFIFIKFIFFPTLGYVTGTELPLAIVESCSMYHQGDIFSNFNEWWQRHENKYKNFIINDLDFISYPFHNGFNKGDILFIIGTTAEKLKQGDVIIFEAGTQNPIIHRIIEIQETEEGLVFSTIGDNNNGQLPYEKTIKETQIVGKAYFKVVPLMGWAKLIFYEGKKSLSERGLCQEN